MTGRPGGCGSDLTRYVEQPRKRFMNVKGFPFLWSMEYFLLHRAVRSPRHDDAHATAVALDLPAGKMLQVPTCRHGTSVILERVPRLLENDALQMTTSTARARSGQAQCRPGVQCTVAETRRDWS